MPLRHKGLLRMKETEKSFEEREDVKRPRFKEIDDGD